MSNINTIHKITPQIIKKGWGRELIFANDHVNGYCGKFLIFDKAGDIGSMHSHAIKSESFIVGEGAFNLECIDPTNATRFTLHLVKGDCVEIPRNQPHRIICIKPGFIVEASTPHFDDDSYRVEKGDSQR